MGAIAKGENLKRDICIWSLALAIVNVVVSLGIFVIPAIIAEGLGGALLPLILLVVVATFFVDTNNLRWTIASTVSNMVAFYIYARPSLWRWRYLSRYFLWLFCDDGIEEEQG